MINLRREKVIPTSVTAFFSYFLSLYFSSPIFFFCLLIRTILDGGDGCFSPEAIQHPLAVVAASSTELSSLSLNPRFMWRTSRRRFSFGRSLFSVLVRISIPRVGGRRNKSLFFTPPPPPSPPATPIIFFQIARTNEDREHLFCR